MKSDYDLVIEEHLNAARCMSVVRSRKSVRSRWVKTEAAVAAERACLVPVFIDDALIPRECKRIKAAIMPAGTALLSRAAGSVAR
jgi:hypothetical protein